MIIQLHKICSSSIIAISLRFKGYFERLEVVKASHFSFLKFVDESLMISNGIRPLSPTANEPKIAQAQVCHV